MANMTLETFLGRGFAFCCHPYAAWRRLPAAGRFLLITAYFGTAYLITLLSLLAAV